MKIAYLCNNYVGLEVLKWLLAEGEDVRLVVVHPDNKAKLKNEIVEAAKCARAGILEAPYFQGLDGIRCLREIKPDILLSVMYDYILGKEIIDVPRLGCINLHNGYLPFNAGNFANVWSIVEGTPAGVTLHYMDEGIDTGSIIAQRQVPHTFIDTGETLFRRLEHAAISLFRDEWHRIRKGNVEAQKQTPGGTYHKKSDVKKIDEIDLGKKYVARDLINILRARTFPPHESAYVSIDGKKYYIRVSIEEEGDGHGQG